MGFSRRTSEVLVHALASEESMSPRDQPVHLKAIHSHVLETMGVPVQFLKAASGLAWSG